MNAIVGALLSVVGEALSPVKNALLADWAASRDLGLNIKSLTSELGYVKVTLEAAQLKQLDGTEMQDLLRKLGGSASDAEDLLDELEYFRIQDELYGTNHAANDDHAKGCTHNFFFNLRHIAKARLGPSLPTTTSPGDDASHGGADCCSWPRARHRPTSTNLAEEEVVRGRMSSKLGKLFLCASSSPPVEGDGGVHSAMSNHHASEIDQNETPKLEFARVDASKQMDLIIQELKSTRSEVDTRLPTFNNRTITDTANHSPIIGRSKSIEPKLFGRNNEVTKIISDMKEGRYLEENLTVLPIVGQGGIGKTTMTQHIYHSDDSEEKKHFSVKIWVRVPRKFNLDKLLEDIKGHIPEIEGENGVSASELIEQWLKSRRFLLVLDDMWECGEDDWKYLLQPFQNSQTKGSMILVTTRVPSLAHMVKTVEKPCELEGLEPKEFKELFLAFVFDGNDPRKYDERLIDVGDKIMVKLKGSPLAAKTVCGILKEDIKFGKWREVLKSKQWEMGSNAADIMPVLKLCYDYLSFELQQCFSSTALFPEDFKFPSKKLIHFWIGLNILHCGDTRKTIEDIGMRNLNELVSRGLLKKEETSGDPYFIVHDLLHDLALMVSSHESLTLHSSSVEPKDCQLCIRHLSIIIYVEGIEDLKGKLRELIKDKFKVEGLRTLMVFGEIDEGFANIFGDLFSAAKAFRVLHLDTIDYPVESILQKLSELVHLRYLFLGTNRRTRMHLPNTISRFYHLQIFDIEEWYGFIDFPRDMSNLRKLCHFITRDHSAQSCIGDVGKLTHLQELKAFEVNKESKGFEAKQLERLNELRELGIYDLEKIVSKEEAAQTKLIEKKYLQRLTLVWTKERPSTSTAPDETIPSGVPDEERLRAELALEREVLESLKPYESSLQALSITGHRGHSCPTWLGDVLVALESLDLYTVSWEDLPCFAKMRYLGSLTLCDIATEKKFDVEHTFCYLTRLMLHGLRSLEDWVPRETNCFPILGELSIYDCPRLLRLPFSDLQDRNKSQFPMLQSLEISNCPEVSSLPPVPWTQNFNCVGMESTGSNILKRLEYRKNSSGAMLEITVNIDLRHLDQVVVFNELREVECLRIDGSGDLPMPLRVQSDREWKIPVKSIWIERDNCSGKELTWLLRHCPDLSKLDISGYAPRTPLVVEGGAKDKQQQQQQRIEEDVDEEGDMVVLPAHLSTTLEELEIDSRNIVVYPLHALKTLKRLNCSHASFSKYFCPFPASLRTLRLVKVSCAGLSNLTSLTGLYVYDSWIIFEGLHTLCELRELTFLGSPNFLDPTRDHLLSSASSKLQSLRTDDIARILTLRVGRFLSSSLTDLTFHSADKNVVRFDKGQEEVLHLLTSLKKLEFSHCRKLQHLPDGLYKLSKLESLTIRSCYSLDSLDANGLPSSLQLLDVMQCNNRKLREQCEKLTGKIKAEVKLAYNDFAY